MTHTDAELEHLSAAMGYRGPQRAFEVGAARARELLALLDRGDIEAARQIAVQIELDLNIASIPEPVR
mgnify:FL=1